MPRHAALSSLALLLACAPARAASAPQPAPSAAEGASVSMRYYDVPAGEATRTLRSFAEQTDEQIFYLVDAVRGVRTAAVRGKFTARQVLERMLQGTPLEMVEDQKSGALAIRARPKG